MEQLVAQIQALQLEVEQLRRARSVDEAHKNYQRAMPTLPTYREGNWKSHLSSFSAWVFSNQLSPEYRRIALYLSVNSPSPRERIAAFGPDGQEWQRITDYEEYRTALTAIFAPDSEKNLAKSEFVAYIQTREEDVATYLSRKQWLFEQSYAAISTDNVDILIHATIRGLYNNVVKRLVTRAAPTTWEGLRTETLKAVSAERQSFLNGYGESTSLDGLCASSTPWIRERTRQPPGEQPMEIESMTNTCRACNRPGHFWRNCLDQRRKKAYQDALSKKKRPDDRKTKRQCAYCQIPGHTEEFCRKKKRDKGRIQRIEPEDEGDWYEEEEEGEEEDNGSVHFLAQHPRHRRY